MAELVEPPVCAAGDSPVVARGGGWCRRRVGYRFTRNLSFGEHHVRRGFLIFVAGAAIGAVADLGAQALGNMANGCDAFDNINWGQVAGNALIGGLSGGRSAFAASRAAKTAESAAARLLTTSEQRAVRSLERRVAEHQVKLDAYRANPDAFDNLGILGRAPTPEIRESIINGRIQHP